MTSTRSRLSYANIMSTLGVVLALGIGTSFAAVQLPKNSVGAVQIKANAVKSAEIKNRAIAKSDLSAHAYADLKAPRAYGVMRSNGTLVVSRSKNVESFNNPGTGDYCINPTRASGVDPEETTILVTPDYSDGMGANHIASVYHSTDPGQPLDCPNGFNVLTASEVAGNFTPTDVAINFVIP